MDVYEINCHLFLLEVSLLQDMTHISKIIIISHCMKLNEKTAKERLEQNYNMKGLDVNEIGTLA